jgi:hypothetical protein
MSLPAAADLAAGFRDPPPEYGPTVTWGWDRIDAAAISRDLDDLHARGFRAVTIEAGYDMPAPYLSEGWFDLVGTAVHEAARRGMRVWIIDEGKYPSGFAGGKFSRERPDLRMQALVIGERLPVAPGETVTRALPPEVVSAAAVRLPEGTSRVLDVRDGRLRWTAPPEGRWEIWLAIHDFRTSPTRSVNNPTRGKDTSSSLFDYLNPAGTRQFIAFTHEQYRRRLGAEFGRTILGFRGDEPDYGHTPWTPGILDEFRRRKGYDVRPYLASDFVRSPSDEVRRARADYWDVWSALFGENFFGIQAEWAARNGLEHLTHVNHEDRAPLLARSDGDYFRDMRSIQIPGIDVIWNQLWPDSTPADFPKLASSAAHLFGRPRAFSESFAAFNPRPTVAQAKWVIDHQLARGISFFEFMFYPSSAGGRGGASGYLADPAFPALDLYTRRLSYLLSQGRPAARIAVYYPTTSFWLGDTAADPANLSVARQLLEAQRDFDWVDDGSLASLLTPRGGSLRNLSGTGYRAVIVPSVTAISRAALDRLRELARAGGSVVFLGRTPTMVVDRTFLHPGSAPELGWATLEASGELTPRVRAALPEPDLQMDRPAPRLSYLHRHLADAELYFLFNEGSDGVSTGVTLEGRGPVQAWDALSGEVSDVASTAGPGDHVRLPLRLGPWETRLLVIRELPTTR